MNLVLVLDENPAVRNSISEILTREGYHVDAVDHWDRAEQGRRYRLVISGRAALPRPLPEGWTLPVIFVAREPSIEDALDAMRSGAVDYFYIPFDASRFLATVRLTLEPADPVDSSEATQPPAPLRRSRSTGDEVEILGDSPQMAMLREMIDKVAASESRILIQGDNGTGKELVACALHHKSKRSAAPFIQVNCAAIPSELIESELFGHEKGSFTSADRMRRGKFEQAEGGTLFLDEIGDMSLAAQSKVLRALQERKITRVGSDRDIPINVRVLSATNKHLREEIEAGHFREDLYHRLAVIVLRVPTLAERTEDIPMLVDHFIEQICAEQGIDRKPIDRQAVARLQRLSWRGNVRELRNVVERLVVLSGERILSHDVQIYVEPVMME